MYIRFVRTIGSWRERSREMFILRRTDQGGGWGARPGIRGSYTFNPLNAKRFSTEEEAERERCPENESIQDLNNLIDRWGV